MKSVSNKPCPVCESIKSESVGIEINSCRIHRCINCTFCWVDREDLKNSPVKPNYENYGYNSQMTMSFEHLKRLYIKGFKARVKHSIGKKQLENCSFLDVGCANGEYLWTAKELGFGSVSGVEIDPVAAKRASVCGEVKENASQLTCTRFDVIQIKNVLSNIPNIIDFMQEYVGLLADNGTLFLDVLNQDCLTATLRVLLGQNGNKNGRFGPIRPPYVINGFNRKSLAALFDRLGLKPQFTCTSYAGHPLIPYKSNPVIRALGFAGSLFGKGSMLVTESVKVNKTKGLIRNENHAQFGC